MYNMVLNICRLTLICLFETVQSLFRISVQIMFQTAQLLKAQLPLRREMCSSFEKFIFKVFDLFSSSFTLFCVVSSIDEVTHREKYTI